VFAHSPSSDLTVVVISTGHAHNLDVAPFNRQALPLALNRGDDEQSRFARHAEPDGERSVAADSNPPRHRVRTDDIDGVHSNSGQESDIRKC